MTKMSTVKGESKGKLFGEGVSWNLKAKVFEVLQRRVKILFDDSLKNKYYITRTVGASY